MNSYITSNKMDTVNQNLPQSKNLGPDKFASKIY